jgi:hypothetical protein
VRIYSILAISVVALFSSGCKRTEFDTAHDRAFAANPSGVELHIATVGGKKQFRLPETVQIEEFYGAKYPGQSHIEVLDGWNWASVADEAHVRMDELHSYFAKTRALSAVIPGTSGLVLRICVFR